MRRDDETEHGVAEELQALVRLLTGRLGAVRPVDDGKAEEVRVDPEVRFEPLALTSAPHPRATAPYDQQRGLRRDSEATGSGANQA